MSDIQPLPCLILQMCTGLSFPAVSSIPNTLTSWSEAAPVPSRYHRRSAPCASYWRGRTQLHWEPLCFTEKRLGRSWELWGWMGSPSGEADYGNGCAGPLSSLLACLLT